MQAAQSAAEADGVVASPSKEDGIKVEADAAAATDGGKTEEKSSDDDDDESNGEEKDDGNGRKKDDASSSSSSAVLPKSKKAKKKSRSSSKKSASTPEKPVLRRGKWTPEEEAYASRLIQEFKAGLLPLTDGTTLRTFLSKLLNCDPMRISKKFVGSNCIGKQVFRRRGADVNNLSPQEVERTRYELSELEKNFLERVSEQGKSKSGSSKSRGRGSKRGGGGGTLPSVSAANGGGLNKSAAAAGRALLQGNMGGGLQSSLSNSMGASDLFSKLQVAQPGMFLNPAANGSQGSLGKYIYILYYMYHKYCVLVNNAMLSPQSLFYLTLYLGNMNNNNNSLANLMLATRMNPEQLSQLSQKGISSSASLANMLGQQRSFDQLMSLDFQSMQSIDNLANLIQAGMPNQAGLQGYVPTSQKKNMDWGSLSSATGVNQSIENLVRTLSAHSGGSGGSGGNGNAARSANQANATNFNNLIQNPSGLNNSLNLGQAGGPSSAQDFSNLLQNLAQQQQNQQQQQQQQQQNNANVNFNNLLHSMAAGNNNSNFLQNANNTNTFQQQNLNQNAGGGNNLLNMLNQSMSGGTNLPQAQNNNNNLNPLMQQLANNSAQSFMNTLQNNNAGGQSALNQGNQMLALAQQQLLAGNTNNNTFNVNNLLGQQNGLAGLGGGNINNNALTNLNAALGGNLGNIGGNLGANYAVSNNFNAAPAANQQQPINNPAEASALLHQLIAQQKATKPPENIAQLGVGTVNNATPGNKRSLDEANAGGGDQEGPQKKQNTTESV